MPTGYTAPITDGITFKEYALGCARAFGALVMMRDDPTGAPIPDAWAVDSYHYTELEKARTELEHFKNLEYEDVEKKYEEYYKASVESYNRTKLEKQALEVKYLRMLADVKEYVAPSDDHVEFKKFMTDQIVQSIEWDCDMKYHNLPRRVDPLDWWSEQVLYLKRAVESRSENLDEEIERINKRNLWIKQLKESLK